MFVVVSFHALVSAHLGPRHLDFSFEATFCSSIGTILTILITHSNVLNDILASSVNSCPDIFLLFVVNSQDWFSLISIFAKVKYFLPR